MPEGHDTGDRVINLNEFGKLQRVPFGAIGTIVGIMKNKYEVVFDKEFIGGSNLGGRCK